MDTPYSIDSIEAEAQEEEKRARTLRFLTDVLFQRLHLESMSLIEAREAVAELRRTALVLFPGKGDVFDLVIAPRMERVITERWGERWGSN
ncbi:hypothetical protein LCGC14_2185260 [marine sediment metagenome]|uniref:Uncharacterized protein n=1 Tax=marine sediment metagenome TaxID=412755 RepID=A0A0F9E870_9ZZZZ